MESKLDKLKTLAPDLRRSEPRAAWERLAGFEMAARCLDKCRATLAGTQGDYQYGCPMDRQFLSEAGIDAGEFKDFVATGATDDEVEAWIRERTAGRRRS